MKKIKGLALMLGMFKSASVYAGGGMVTRAIPFLLLPILTRYLTPQDYGVLAIFMATYGIIQIFSAMGAQGAVTRAYFDKEKESFNFPQYVFNGLLIPFAVCITIFVIWLIGKPYFVKVIPVPFKYQLVIPLISFFAIVYGLVFKLWVFMKRPVLFTVFNTSNVLLEVALAVILITVIGYNWEGRVWGIIISRFILFVVGICVLLKYNFLQFSISKVYIKDILSFGFPVVLHSLGFAIIAAIDRFFISSFIDLSTAGIYAVSYSICSLIAFATGAFNLAWSPIFYEKIGKMSWVSKITLAKYTYVYFAVIFIGVVLFIKIVPSVLSILVGDKFLGAGTFMVWLALGFGFQGMYNILVFYIFYEKKTYVLSKIAIVTVVLSFISNYILIMKNGAIGVAQATCLIFFVRFILVWYFSNKVHPMPWLFFINGSKAPQTALTGE